ncbi:hypothetical protein [Luteimonas salinilitoris]|uniref:Uncharacterized protein n=1 Tax=Luteimonas salinilitoris TaxID=3237697 RepID=A0ABV4HPF1_9GAMM
MEASVFALAVMISLASGCSGQGSRPGSLQVSDISETALDTSASSQEGATAACEGWALTRVQAEEFFSLSESIDQREFHHEYDTAPCKITGSVDAEGRPWRFTINGAAKAIWEDGDEVRYFGCSAPACRPLVLWEYTGTDIE